MKKALILCIILSLSVISIHSYAQAPQGFKYQSVARNTSGLPIASSNIGLRVRIHDQTETGTIVYSETHTAATNAFGVFSLSIGGGTPQSGTFNTIDWGTGAKFIEIEADFSGGTSYTSMGASQLLSVPYALYSENGTPGLQGPIGLTGADGAIGPQGIQGVKGDDGDSGVAFDDAQVLTDKTWTSSKIDSELSAKVNTADVSTVGTTGSYNDLIDQPTLATVASSGDYDDLVNSPVLFTGAYGDLTGAPALSTVAISGDYSDLLNQPLTDGSETKVTAGSNVTVTGSGTTGSPYVLNAAGSSGWSLTGNGGTTLPLEFSVDNVRSGMIEPIITNGYSWGANTFFGSSAGKSLLSGYNTNTLTLFGSYNTAVGSESMSETQDGIGNTALGHSTLRYGTGNYNTVVGTYAIEGPSSGSQNTAVGYRAGNLLTSGFNNTLIGFQTNVGSGSLINATAIGSSAIVNASNSMQLGNAAVTQIFAGTGATATLIAGGLQVTGGTPAAGKVLTSDATGVATWQAAGGSGWGLTGNSGTVDGTNFIGTIDNIPLNFRVNNRNAGRINNSVANTFFGYESGNPTTSGSGISGYGHQSLKDNTTGINNTASGAFSLYSNTVGSGNAAFGLSALYSNVIGSGNTASGSQSLQNNIGGENTALGYQSFFGNTSGTGNTAVGYRAGYTSFSNANTTGTNNTFIGYKTGLSSPTQLTNATAIGNEATVNTSNTIQLGNPSVTDVFAGTGTTTTLHTGGLQVTGSSPGVGKVLTSDATGVATWQTAAGGGLTGSGTLNYLPKFTPDGTSLGNSLIFEDGTFVGLGTATPTYLFDVRANTVSAGVNFENANPNGWALRAAATGSGYGVYGQSSTGIGIYGTASTGKGVRGYATASGGYGIEGLATNGAYAGIFTGGNVGIGTLTPGASLDILGTIKISDGSQGAGKVLTSDANGLATWQAAGGGSGWGLTGNSGTVDGTDFIGTTDNRPLNFKVNNIKAGRIDTQLYNTFFGRESGSLNSTGSINTANGAYSLASNTTGMRNTAIGGNALVNSSTGNNNTAVGVWALNFNASGSFNTSVGVDAISNSTGSNNTALGNTAGINITTGSNNTVVGNNAQVPSATSSNQIRIGDTNITYAGIQVAWTVTSDKRWKSNITESNLGLDFISQLKPVSYFRNNDESKKREYGFIAQELEETLKVLGTHDSGIISKDDKGMLSVRYNDLLAPMVKAIQEQQLLIQELKSKIQELEKEASGSKEMVSKIEIENTMLKSDFEARLKKLEEMISATAKK